MQFASPLVNMIVRCSWVLGEARKGPEEVRFGETPLLLSCRSVPQRLSSALFSHAPQARFMPNEPNLSGLSVRRDVCKQTNSPSERLDRSSFSYAPGRPPLGPVGC